MSSKASSSSTPSSSSSSSSRESSPESSPRPSPALVAAYDALMAARLPNLPKLEAASEPSPPAEVPDAADAPDAAEEAALGRPLTKAEKQNAKKKRRKERERLARAETAAVRAEPVEVVAAAEVVEFPLFAGPTPVSLSTAEHYALPSNPRLVPLPVAVRERIARLAAEAAYGAENSLSLPGRQGEVGEMILESAGLPRGLPPVFIAQAKGETRKGVPRLKVKAAEVEAEKPRRKRRKGREFPPAQFWAPEEGCEGRSAGYFYGWSV